MINQLPNNKFLIVGEKKVHKTLQDMVEYLEVVGISSVLRYRTVIWYAKEQEFAKATIYNKGPLL